MTRPDPRRPRMRWPSFAALAAGSIYLVTSGRAAPAPPPREPLVTTAARTIGVRRCLPVIAAIAERGISGATMQDIMIDWNHQSPDAAPFFSVTGMGRGDQRALLSITTISSPTGGCSALVERVSATARACPAVAASELPGFPGTRLIDGIMVYQNPQQASETYMLVANGTGCLVVRRQASLK